MRSVHRKIASRENSRVLDSSVSSYRNFPDNLDRIFRYSRLWMRIVPRIFFAQSTLQTERTAYEKWKRNVLGTVYAADVDAVLSYALSVIGNTMINALTSRKN